MTDTERFDYRGLYGQLAATAAAPWLDTLPQQVAAALAPQRHGHLPRWRTAVEALPPLVPSQVDVTTGVTVGAAADGDPGALATLEAALGQLIPWRKGPMTLFGVTIDAEWRSDWKWNRLKTAIAPLAGRRVLDVGCGNGYYAWRMAGAGAKLVVGLDPSLLFVMQYWAVRRYLAAFDVFVLPLGVEALPPALGCFDTVFSMGVLYHRRHPREHLAALYGALRPGGELVLETLVVEGDPETVLVPRDRYAQMRNVWAIPSPGTLLNWLTRGGFVQPRLVDLTATTGAEQRTTAWMPYHSLANFLDPEDTSRTVEGYPAPLRGSFIARRPGP